MGFGITILVAGKRACFTRPELHTERVSYDVITPSAARGVLEAVYWKPAIRWVVDEITVLNPIEFETIRRNEVSSKISVQNALRARDGAMQDFCQIATRDRAQRNTLSLKNVAYVIKAHFELTAKAGTDDTPEKHYNMALRRLRKGQSFHHAYLGCREFPCDITLVEEGNTPLSCYDGTGERDLGFMLYDLDYSNPEKPEPVFFRAVMENGTIDVSKAQVIK